MKADRDVPVNLDSLADWMRARGFAGKHCTDVRRLTGGTQNLLVQFVFGGRGFVLRRPPEHAQMGAGRIVERESRVLGALAGSAVPHPGLIAVCHDAAIVGGPFLLMEPIAGFCATQGLPGPVRADPSIQAMMGFAMVDAALALGAVDHIAVGLADFGKTENYLERQVSRWRTQLESYRLHDRWDGETDMAGVDKVGEWLDAHRPPSFMPGIIHGDYHLANVMFAPDGRRLAAVIDWELASLGDPLLDLGWMLATWPNPDGSDSGSGLAAPGCDALPPPQALLERYAAGTPRDLSHFEWYPVLACYKLAILQEGSYARACAGKADPKIGREQHARAVAMIGRARKFIAAVPAPVAELNA